MSAQDVDQGKRRFLTAATTAVGAVGAGFVAVPFVKSMLPNAAVLAEATTDVDISKVEPGMQLTVLWRGKPVAIVKRTPEMLASLKEMTSQLRDPQSAESQQPAYAKNEWRSLKPEWLIMLQVCTHLGCVPLYKPKPGDVGADWKGGYFCPCHGSKYDLAGRVFSGVPAPKNMDVPPHVYVSDTQLIIGKDQA